MTLVNVTSFPLGKENSFVPLTSDVTTIFTGREVQWNRVTVSRITLMCRSTAAEKRKMGGGPLHYLERGRFRFRPVKYWIKGKDEEDKKVEKRRGKQKRRRRLKVEDW